MTGPNPCLVQIGPLDMALVSALHGQCFADEPWDERAVAEILAMPGSFGFIATNEGLPAGFVIARVAADECEIVSLGVCPPLRQAGFGRELLKAALAKAATCQVRSAFLEVAEDNMPARRLYKSEGFVLAGRRSDYYRSARGRDTAALVLVCGSP